MIGASRWAATVIGTLACMVALACVQRLATRTGWRLDLTPEQGNVLSENARALLAGLERPVTATAFLRSEDPRNREMEDLLRRVSAEQPLIQYRVVDLNRNPALAQRFGVDAYGAVVVESEGRRDRFYQPHERDLIAAILQVTRPGHRQLYFSSGNGEREPGDRDERRGYFNAAIALYNELYDVDVLALDANTPVPPDARALVIAGPRRNLPPSAIAQIDAYLRRGGRVLALLDPDDSPSIMALLQRYGVVVSDEVVLDPERRLFAGDALTLPVTGATARHPVSAAQREPALFSGARAVRSAPAGAARQAADLLVSSPLSWRTPDRGALERGTGEFLAGRDTRGPVSVAAGALIGRPDGDPGRLLVIGDADFAANMFLDYLGNRDLLLNAVNWLAGEEHLVGRRPPRKLPGVHQLYISEEQGTSLLWLAAGLQPALVAMAGVLVYGVRRRHG